MSATRIEVRKTRTFANGRPIYDLFADGQFILGAANTETLEARQTALEANQWRFLSLTGHGEASPLAFIERVRSVGARFDESCSLTVSDERSFFTGSIDQGAAEFKFLILDVSVTDQIRSLAREVSVRDFRHASALAA